MGAGSLLGRNCEMAHSKHCSKSTEKKIHMCNSTLIGKIHFFQMEETLEDIELMRVKTVVQHNVVLKKHPEKIVKKNGSIQQKNY